VTADRPALVVLSARDDVRLKAQAEQLLQAIEDRSIVEDELADVAYTLQVGREAMGVRLACVVASLDALRDGLRAFLRGDPGVEGLYHGDVRRNKEALEAFKADAELQEAVVKWIQLGKFHKLMELWTKGLSLDWHLLHGDDKPRRISLPTYPFARDRYWAPDSLGAATAPNPGPQRLHPLVHQNTSGLDGLRFSATFTGRESFFQALPGQTPDGDKELPAMALIEIAHEAVRRCHGELEASACVHLEQVVFGDAMVAAHAGLTLHISLQGLEDGAIAFEVHSGEGEAACLHGHGLAKVAADTDEPPGPCDLVALGREASEHGQVLSDLALSRSAQGVARGVSLHPEMMETACRVATALLPGGQAAPALSVQRVTVVSRWPERA